MVKTEAAGPHEQIQASPPLSYTLCRGDSFARLSGVSSAGRLLDAWYLVW